MNTVFREDRRGCMQTQLLENRTIGTPIKQNNVIRQKVKMLLKEFEGEICNQIVNSSENLTRLCELSPS